MEIDTENNCIFVDQTLCKEPDLYLSSLCDIGRSIYFSAVYEWESKLNLALRYIIGLGMLLCYDLSTERERELRAKMGEEHHGPS